MFTFNSTPFLLLSGNCFYVCILIMPCSLNVCPYAQKELYSGQGLGVGHTLFSPCTAPDLKKAGDRDLWASRAAGQGMSDLFEDSSRVQVTMYQGQMVPLEESRVPEGCVQCLHQPIYIFIICASKPSNPCSCCMPTCTRPLAAHCGCFDLGKGLSCLREESCLRPCRIEN